MSSATYYLNSGGSNTTPFDTPEKGANTFYDVWQWISYVAGWDNEINFILCSDIQDTGQWDDYNDFRFYYGYGTTSYIIKSNTIGAKWKLISYGGLVANADESGDAHDAIMTFEDISFFPSMYFAIDPMGTLTFNRCNLTNSQSINGSYYNLVSTNCLVVDPGSCVVFSNSISASHNITVVNNTFVGGEMVIVDYGANANSFIVENNIFYGQTSSFIYQSYSMPTGSVIANNCFYAGIPIDYMNWGSASPGGGNLGLDVEPYGLDPKLDGSYHLLSDSPCLDYSDQYVQPSDDYDGSSRDYPTDTGAYQSSYEPSTTTTVAPTTTTTTTMSPTTTTTAPTTTVAPTTTQPPYNSNNYKYVIELENADLSYLKGQTFSFYITSGSAYNIKPYVINLPNTQVDIGIYNE